MGQAGRGKPGSYGVEFRSMKTDTEDGKCPFLGRFAHLKREISEKKRSEAQQWVQVGS